MILQRTHQPSVATDVSARDLNYYQKLIASFRWKKLGLWFVSLLRCRGVLENLCQVPFHASHHGIYVWIIWSSMILQTLIEPQKILSEVLLIECLMFHMFHGPPCCFEWLWCSLGRKRSWDVMTKRPGCCNMLQSPVMNFHIWFIYITNATWDVGRIM